MYQIILYAPLVHHCMHVASCRNPQYIILYKALVQSCTSVASCSLQYQICQKTRPVIKEICSESECDHLTVQSVHPHSINDTKGFTFLFHPKIIQKKHTFSSCIIFILPASEKSTKKLFSFLFLFLPFPCHPP